MSRPAVSRGRALAAGRPTLTRDDPAAPDRAPSPARAGRRRVLRAMTVPAASVIVYFAVRPAIESDAAGLAIAGAVPAAYAIIAVAARQRVEPWAVLTAVGYALGCLASLLAGDSPLPLKLHEAAITFLIGVVLLAAVLVRRPLPAGRLLKVPRADRAMDAALSVMAGGFLVLHALLHLALALTLSTAAYLTAGRAVSWATLAAGGLCLYGYLRRLRRRQAATQESPDAPAAPPGRRS